MKRRGVFLRGIQVAVLGTALTLGVTAQPTVAAEVSSPDLCMQDNYTNHDLGQTLNCTSNDVRIARVTNITDLAGNALTSCIAGAEVTFQADFEVVLTAQDRYDVGLYLATDGDLNGDGALTGECAASIVTGNPTPNPNALNFINLDIIPDNCGDIKGKLGSSFNPQKVHMKVTTLCTGDSNAKLLLPNCTSWRQPGSNEVCTGIVDAYPGSPSKCNCDKNFTIDVNVERPRLTVTKAPYPLTIGEPGGDITYTVTVTNPASVVSVTLDTIVDDPDDNPATNDSITYTDLGNRCTKTVLKPGESTVCTFTQTVAGNPGDIFTDQACVSGTDSNSPPQTVGPSCAKAAVTIVGVEPSASLVKKVIGAVATFEVKVQNTSTVEPGTLKALCDDKYGTIAIAPGSGLTCPAGTLGSVVGTPTCSLPQTLAINGQTGDSYTCSFDVVVSIDGSEHADTVTGTVYDDEDNYINPSGSATVKVTHTP